MSRTRSTSASSKASAPDLAINEGLEGTHPLFGVAMRETPYAVVAAFRREVYARNKLSLFPHQAEWQLASEGWSLLDTPPSSPGDHFVTVTIPASDLGDRERPLHRFTERGIKCAVVRRLCLPRIGGVAHNLVDLAAYKGGKSYGAAAWATGFACLPNGKVEFIGLEYGTSEPEFNYLLDFLLSEDGMNMKHDSLQNDPRGGRMRLVLSNGAEFRVASWTRKESLKGKKRHAYIYTEAYQLPGIEVYNTIRQNLREHQGFAVFVTTPDKPWIATLHEKGHGADADWHCTCGVDARSNPFTYDQKARDQDDPEKGGGMTKERYAIAWGGMIGAYVGQVYNFQRGQMLFTPRTHPWLFRYSALVKEIRDGK